MHLGRDKIQRDLEWRQRDLERRFGFSTEYYTILNWYCNKYAVCRATTSPNHSTQGNPVDTPVCKLSTRSMPMYVFVMPELTVEGEKDDCIISALHRHSGYVMAVPGKNSKQKDKKENHAVGLQATTVPQAMKGQ